MGARPRTRNASTAEFGSAERLITAIQDLSLAQDLNAITEIVRHTARELTGADGATFVLREGGLCHYVDEDAIGPLWKGRRFPLQACISGWVMLHRQAVAIEDIYDDARVPVDAYRPTFVKSLVMVPIRTLDPLGAIGTYWANTHSANPEEIHLLQALADATAVAIERARLYDELEQRVRERTSALEAAYHRLAAETPPHREAERGVGDASPDVRRFLQRDRLAGVLASGIAHELNQPLSAAIAYADAAARLLGQPDGDRGEALEAMEKATAQNWRAVKIIRQFRELLRRGELDFQPSDLNDVMRSAILLVEEEAQGYGLAVGLDFTEGLRRVRCDCSSIEHVTLNLLRNAIEAMRDGGVVRGSARVRVRPGRAGFVHISVADDGPGLDAAARKNLFKPFYTTKQAGLGLGLSVSRAIVEAHGGELWADANEHGGAAFHFTLPL